MNIETSTDFELLRCISLEKLPEGEKANDKMPQAALRVAQVRDISGWVIFPDFWAVRILNYWDL